jgi:hypothetical protein
MGWFMVAPWYVVEPWAAYFLAALGAYSVVDLEKYSFVIRCCGIAACHP